MCRLAHSSGRIITKLLYCYHAFKSVPREFLSTSTGVTVETWSLFILAEASLHLSLSVSLYLSLSLSLSPFLLSLTALSGLRGLPGWIDAGFSCFGRTGDEGGRTEKITGRASRHRVAFYVDCDCGCGSGQRSTLSSRAPLPTRPVRQQLDGTLLGPKLGVYVAFESKN